MGTRTLLNVPPQLSMLQQQKAEFTEKAARARLELETQKKDTKQLQQDLNRAKVDADKEQARKQ